MSITTPSELIAGHGGNLYPCHDGQPLAWSPGLYQTFAEQELGFPRMRAVLRAMRDHRPEQLRRERFEMLRGSFCSLFGRAARLALEIIDEECPPCA